MVFNENLRCPVTGEPLNLSGGLLKTPSGRTYEFRDGVPLLFVEGGDGAGSVDMNQVTSRVKDFYSDAPFPNYNEFDNIGVLIKRAREGIFARLLSEQIPANSCVLEIGCGTGQLTNYLAATTMSRVYGADMTPASLALGQKFARDNGIGGVTFVQMNLFRPCINPGSMDIVIANGVLHHTHDTREAFHSVTSLVKPGGYLIIGLYNWIGRLRTDFRRLLLKTIGEPTLVLDPHLRKNLSAEKRRAWINDQYRHPCEHKHSMSEVLRWFDEASFAFVSSIPKVLDDFSDDELLFEPKDPGTWLDRTLTEAGMLLSNLGGEGGLFTMIGRKL